MGFLISHLANVIIDGFETERLCESIKLCERIQIVEHLMQKPLSILVND